MRSALPTTLEPGRGLAPRVPRPEILNQSEDAIVFRYGGGARLPVTKRTTGDRGHAGAMRSA